MNNWISKKVLTAGVFAAVAFSNVSALDPLYAGLRASKYGFGVPDIDKFGKAIKSMASRWNATPSVVWIASTYSGAETEKYLTYFDNNGITCILQVEPFSSSVTASIDNLLGAYKSHKSVIGYGIDVEWYKGGEIGTPVTDAEARQWRAKIVGHNPNYILMLKHFFPRYVPATEREGILFLDDSQQFPSFDRFINETNPATQWNIGYRTWAKEFSAGYSGMQFGYNDAAGGPSDKKWWSQLNDPPKEIGDSVLSAGANTRFLYWVDFTWQDSKVSEWKLWSPPGLVPPNHPASKPVVGIRRFAASESGMNFFVRDQAIFIRNPAEYGKEIGVQVMGLNGTVLMAKSFSGKSDIEVSLDPALAKGQYLLKVVSGKQAWNGKFSR